MRIQFAPQFAKTTDIQTRYLWKLDWENKTAKMVYSTVYEDFTINGINAKVSDGKLILTEDSYNGETFTVLETE